MLLVLWTKLAVAATPVFVADVANDADVAASAWDAASECTGWVAPAHDVVRVVRGHIAGGFLGRAKHDDRGLYSIELASDRERIAEVIVHEVAHAWVNQGPPTLVEGRTELLADCIVRRRRGLAPLQWDDGRDLNAMPDLLSWNNTRDHGPAVLADARTDAYLGSARLVRAVALFVDEQDLWAKKGFDWASFRGLLETHGAHGEAVLGVLDGGVEAQRRALDDDDRDGLSHLAERILGTDPEDWDSDQDGWWDGSHLVAPGPAMPLSFDGAPICTGFAAGPSGASVQVVSGGTMRGATEVDVVIVGGGQQARLPPGASVLLALKGSDLHSNGGLWASIAGSSLVKDARCRTTAGSTVWTDDERYAHLVGPLSSLLDEVGAEATLRWGLLPGRVALRLGGPTTTVVGQVVVLADQDLNRRSGSSLLEQARLVVAVHRLWSLGYREWTTAVALARMLAES